MSFDKKKYWERRNKGLSGQEPVAKSGVVHDVDRRLTRKALLNNTKRSRKLAVDLDADGGITI